MGKAFKHRRKIGGGSTDQRACLRQFVTHIDRKAGIRPFEIWFNRPPISTGTLTPAARSAWK